MKPIPSARRAAPFALSALLALCASAADVTIATSSDIAKQCYAVGDTVTVSGGDAAAVLGDGVAALAGQVLTMKHPGFTLLKDSGGTEYCFGVYETPGGAGDVFLFDWSANNVSWTSAAWANLTGNSERTFPDHADDVAMILNIVGNNYRYITVPPEGVTLGQLIVGTSLHFTLNHTGGSVTPLVFSRTDGAAPRICLSRPASSGTGDVHFRFGEYDSDNGGNVLAVSFAGPAFEVDFCGDTAASAAYARKGGLGFMFGRGKIAVGDGQTLILRNGSRLATDFVNVSRCRLGSGVFGAGTVEVRDVAFDFQSRTPDAYFDVGLFRSVEGFGPFDPADNNTSRYTTRFNAVPSVPVEILSARCPTNLNPHTVFRNYWDSGVSNAWLSPSVLLSGCNYELQQNGAYAPHWDFWDSTNEAARLTIRGHVGFYGPVSYGRDGNKDENGVQKGRVVHEIEIEDLERYDRWSTAQANGLNLNRGDANTNDVKGVFYVKNWADHVVRPAGVDPSDYSATVYPIIPWMTVHANDNSQVLTEASWGSEQTFPGVRETDGSIRLVLHQNNRGTDSLSARGPNENFYFCGKSNFTFNGADRTLFSLVYCSQETPPYVGNFYLDSAAGGHKLFLTSGAMAITRQNKWLGQPDDMTRNGMIVLQGDPAYLHVTSGLYGKTGATEGTDYNMCWVQLVASNDLVKASAGSIGLAGDQRGIRGTLVVNAGELYLGYPAYKKNGYLYNYAHANNGWPMHGCATDCDFRVRGGAVLAFAAAGYQGKDLNGNDVDAPVVAWGADNRHTLVLERSGLSVGGVYVAEDVEATFYEAFYETEAGEEVTFARGTWGSSESAAEHVDDTYFAGPGVLMVQHDRLVRPTMLLIK